MTPPVIEQAIAKVEGAILKCDPVCDGSKHYIVTFTAPDPARKKAAAMGLSDLRWDRVKSNAVREKHFAVRAITVAVVLLAWVLAGNAAWKDL